MVTGFTSGRRKRKEEAEGGSGRRAEKKTTAERESSVWVKGLFRYEWSGCADNVGLSPEGKEEEEAPSRCSSFPRDSSVTPARCSNFDDSH
jgi:hypothetical protein